MIDFLQTSTTSRHQSLLLLGFYWLSRIGDFFVRTVPFHEFRDIKLGLLEHLDLTNVAVLDGEDR